MKKSGRKRDRDLARAKELSALWSDNEEYMGEMAAYLVSCEQLGIEPDEGWDLLALLSEEQSLAELEKSKEGV